MNLLRQPTVLRSTHEYQLAETYLQRAKTAGAPDAKVRIGLANNYLALGDTAKAKAELAAVSARGDDTPDYQYLIAEANVFRQEHQGAQALTSFAQARMPKAKIDSAEQSMLAAGADEGLRVTPTLSLLSDFSRRTYLRRHDRLRSRLEAGRGVRCSAAPTLPFCPRRALLFRQNGPTHFIFISGHCPRRADSFS